MNVIRTVLASLALASLPWATLAAPARYALD
jgi:hypothetical protein